MATLAGLIAFVVVTAATALFPAILLDMAGVRTGQQWLVYFIGGVSLSLGAAAFYGTKTFVALRPELRRYIGRALLVGCILGLLYGVKELYPRWRLHQVMTEAQAVVAKGLPRRLDNCTTLVTTKLGFTDLTYLYSVDDGCRLNPDIEKDVRRGVCASDMKNSISGGASYRYEYRNSKDALLARFDIGSCP
jgi:hypothetical protein